MIPGFIRRLFTLDYDYGTLLEQQRAQRLLYIISTILMVTAAWAVVVSIPTVFSDSATVQMVLIPSGIFVVSMVLYLMLQRGQMKLAARIFVAVLLLVTVPFQTEDAASPLVINVMLPLILATVLLSLREIWLVTVIIIVLIARALLLTNLDLPINTAESVVILLTVFLCGFFLVIFKTSLDTIIESSSELIIKARQLGNRESLRTDDTIESIVSVAINHLRVGLGYNYIRVVMLDDDMQPVQSYYSSIGVERVAQTAQFSYTANSALQQALDKQEPMVVTRSDSGNLAAHLLPSSGSGVIIPAQSFDQVVALFDIQTESDTPISPEVVNILDLFVKQVASTLVYQRMLTALTGDIEEQQVIINQQRQQINNLQLRQTEGIVTDWQYYLQQRGLESIGYDIDDKRQISALNSGQFTEDLRRAFDDGEIVVQTNDDGQEVVIPIQFRDAVLGVISFRIPKEIPVTERKLEFLRSVTERLALALDNKRLLEQTQTQAQRETTANEIGSDLLSSTDVQSVLQTAVERFNEALGAISTRIYIQPTSLKPAEDPLREDSV